MFRQFNMKYYKKYILYVNPSFLEIQNISCKPKALVNNKNKKLENTFSFC